MSLYTALAVSIGIAAGLGGSYAKGRSDGRKVEYAEHTSTEELINKVSTTAKEAASLGAADAIAKIEVRHVTIQGKLQKEVFTNTVYADCKHTPASLQLLNDALTDGGTTKAGPVGGVELPASGPVGRP